MPPSPPIEARPSGGSSGTDACLGIHYGVPPNTTSTAGDWSWLSSLEGIDRATRIELPVNQEAIPHIVGSKGRTIRALEDKFGVVLGVMDVLEMGALVTFLGPQVPVLWAKVAVELLARGARIALDRIGWSLG